ncbi:hypothetical protein [Alloactinosynnema sp. L-07]|nr:hypothetical protein [Alloactinosynnema sp. L-07]CRK60936.1 hypothetical protein [Alloactinosynnema sp. L-07]
MPDTAAFAILLACLAIMSVLGKARVLGALAVTGFVLGAISAASVFVMIS